MAEIRFVHPTFLEHMVSEYADAAMRHVRTQQFPDGTWFADVAGLDGAWFDGDTEVEAIRGLRDVIFDWAWLKVTFVDGDVPLMNDIDLNVLRLQKVVSG